MRKEGQTFIIGHRIEAQLFEIIPLDGGIRINVMRLDGLVLSREDKAKTARAQKQRESKKIRRLSKDKDMRRR